MEGPDPDEGGEEVLGDSKRVGLGKWVKGQLSRTPSMAGCNSNNNSNNKRGDLRLLLGVMGAPLAPVYVSSCDPLPHLSIKDTPIVNLSLTLFVVFLKCVFYFYFVCFGSL